ncbi:hypothetical protein H6F51_03410 [Cyanobacteria bacterium FACHB-DQ100]|nr:hypothetical protein [Cyanobacteria bacterium FACHB-DQ100]
MYAWDSLCAASEAEIVGRAAAQFTAQWDILAPLTPSPDGARAFVQEYEIARGQPFSEEERVVLAASADYCVAQIARFEFASGCSSSDGFLALLQDWGRNGFLVVGTN